MNSLIHRREFVKIAAQAAALGVVPSAMFSCKTPQSSSVLTDGRADLAFLDRFGPITPHHLHSAAVWQGDFVDFAHRAVRDGEVPSNGIESREKVELVVVGAAWPV